MASLEGSEPPDKINADSDQLDELNEIEENTESSNYMESISRNSKRKPGTLYQTSPLNENTTKKHRSTNEQMQQPEHIVYIYGKHQNITKCS